MFSCHTSQITKKRFGGVQVLSLPHKSQKRGFVGYILRLLQKVFVILSAAKDLNFFPVFSPTYFEILRFLRSLRTTGYKGFA
jgi:hypothetical protein